jgi:hypothetical protein
VLVSTFRGRRSQWPRNLAADRAPSLWLHGRARSVNARVFAPGVRASRRPLPRELRWLPALLAPYTRAGWAFAVLSPPGGEARGGDGAAARRPKPSPRAGSRPSGARSVPSPRTP